MVSILTPSPAILDASPPPFPTPRYRIIDATTPSGNWKLEKKEGKKIRVQLAETPLFAKVDMRGNMT